MKKSFISFLALLFVAQMGWAASVTPAAQIPTYWASANGKSGATLWSAISTQTNVGYHSLSYNGLWTAYATTDVYPGTNKIWDMYGECDFTYSTDQCGTYNGVCDCYNREHSIPKSYWGGSTSGIGCDIFHLVPTDGKINGVRSNDEFGEVNGGTDWNGNKSGTAGSWSTDKKTIASTAGEVVSGSGNVFEPKAQYKGDFARGYMGTIIKWELSGITTDNNFFSGIYDAAHYFGFTKKAVVLMMKWHREDPVSQKEIDRNNGIQQTQGNRNPFIDYPYLAEYIWGEHAGETVDMSLLMPSTDPNFVPGVSNGWRGGDTPPTPPTPVTKYAVTWSENGIVTLVDSIAENGALVLPANTPANCSENRVFRGWTATPNYEGDNAPADLFTEASGVVTAPLTFYAVYADRQAESGYGEEGSVTSIVMEEEQAINGTFSGFVFNAQKNTGTNEPTYNAGGKDGRVYAKGSLTISSSEAMSQIVFNISAQGRKRLAPITASEGTIAAQVSGDTTVTWTGSATSVTFTVGDQATYGSESSKAGQLCFTSVDITTGGGGAPAFYSNFSLRCSSEPIVDPDYTVTFYSNGSEYASRIGHAGDSMEPVTEPVAPCDRYTFAGWSTYQYPIESTELPVFDFTGLIPEENIAYYAVFNCLAEQEPSLSSDEYLKISSTQELTSGNYLVVGEKDGLFAMSATFTGYYLRNAVVQAYGNIISYPADSIIWNIAVNEDGTLTFRNAEAGYLYIEKSVNGTKTYYNIKLGENTTDNKFTYAINAQTGGWIFTSVTYPERQLEYYSSKSYWTYYTSQDAPVSLYQQQTGGEDIVLYTTAPWCTSTAIQPVPSLEPTRKILIGGQIYILREGEIYSLTGARIR